MSETDVVKLIMILAASLALAAPQPNAPAGAWYSFDSPDSTSVAYRAKLSSPLLDFDCEQQPHYLRIDAATLSAKGLKKGSHGMAILGGKAFDAKLAALGTPGRLYVTARVKLTKDVLASLGKPGPFGLVLKSGSLIAMAKPPVPGKWAPSPNDLISGCTSSMNGDFDDRDDDENGD